MMNYQYLHRGHRRGGKEKLEEMTEETRRRCRKVVEELKIRVCVTANSWIDSAEE